MGNRRDSGTFAVVIPSPSAPGRKPQNQFLRTRRSSSGISGPPSGDADRTFFAPLGEGLMEMPPLIRAMLSDVTASHAIVSVPEASKRKRLDEDQQVAALLIASQSSPASSASPDTGSPAPSSPAESIVPLPRPAPELARTASAPAASPVPLPPPPMPGPSRPPPKASTSAPTPATRTVYNVCCHACRGKPRSPVMRCACLKIWCEKCVVKHFGAHPLYSPPSFVFVPNGNFTCPACTSVCRCKACTAPRRKSMPLPRRSLTPDRERERDRGRDRGESDMILEMDDEGALALDDDDDFMPNRPHPSRRPVKKRRASEGDDDSDADRAYRPRPAVRRNTVTSNAAVAGTSLVVKLRRVSLPTLPTGQSLLAPALRLMTPPAALLRPGAPTREPPIFYSRTRPPPKSRSAPGVIEETDHPQFTMKASMRSAALLDDDPATALMAIDEAPVRPDPGLLPPIAIDDGRRALISPSSPRVADYFDAVPSSAPAELSPVSAFSPASASFDTPSDREASTPHMGTPPSTAGLEDGKDEAFAAQFDQAHFFASARHSPQLEADATLLAFGDVDAIMSTDTAGEREADADAMVW